MHFCVYEVAIIYVSYFPGLLWISAKLETDSAERFRMFMELDSQLMLKYWYALSLRYEFDNRKLSSVLVGFNSVVIDFGLVERL